MHRSSASQSLPQWLAWLETLSPNEIELGLDRVDAVLDRLQLARPERVIHVAGTNGKGSSAVMLEALFLQQGVSVGCYTSPHIRCYNERIRLAGEAVADDDILQAFNRVEFARQGVRLTYFEYGTLAALCVFDHVRANTVILEIGMGGRLDAVNAVEPDAGIITNVSLDHIAWLGADVETIAAEKAGVLRSNKPFVFAGEELPQAIAKKAQELSVDLRVLNRDYRYARTKDGAWQFSGRNCHLTRLQAPSLGGDIQIQNAAAVLALVEAIGETGLLSAERIDAAFSTLQLPGRLQRVDRGQRWILDVAHNAAAATALSGSLKSIGLTSGLRCIIGVLDDKYIADIIGPLLPLVEEWIAVAAASPRTVPVAELGREVANLSGRPCRLVDQIEIACEQINADTSSGLPVLVTGSFFTVGPALAWLAENPER